MSLIKMCPHLNYIVIQMEEIKGQYDRAQQNRQYAQKQLNDLTVQFEMISILSSNSQASPSDGQAISPHLDIKESASPQLIKEVEVAEVAHDDQNQKSNGFISIPNVPQVGTGVPTVIEKASYEPTLNKPKNEVIENNEDNLLENSFTSSKQLDSVESFKLFSSKQANTANPVHGDFREEFLQQVIEEVSPKKQELHCSNSKKKEKSKEFRISCQRNTVNLVQNRQKAKEPKENPANTKKKPVKEKVQVEPGFKEYQTKYNIEFEQYFQKCKVQFCSEYCPEGNKIEWVCVQKGCQSQAAHCSSLKCTTCKKNHKDCYLKFTCDMFHHSLQKNLSRQKKTMQIVYECYSNILTQIKQNRQKIMKLLCVQGVKEGLFAKLEQRYKTNGHISFQSCEVLSALEMLNTQSQNNQYRQCKIYEKMKKDQKDILQKLQQEMHLLLEPYAICKVNVLDSHLVTAKADAKFILEHLNLPKDMHLLYRASEHEFSIKKFHQICDKQDNTFTIIKTQFGKLIGGYTPLKWNNKYGRDRSNKTFLLSISMKERLEHIKHGESAIYFSDQFGPSFGGLFEHRDIEIFQENGLLNCNTNFPNAYNWKKFFNSSQQSWRFLTGVQAGKKCRVMDYEVFKVISWQEKQ